MTADHDRRQKREHDTTLGDVPSVAVPITAGVLDWAMERSALTTRALADELDQPEDLVAEWRRGAASPTTGQFRALARALQRPESFFFLARPPREDDVPPAFRSPPPGVEGGGISAKDAAHVRTAKRVQTISKWLVERGHRSAPTLPRVDSGTSPETVAARLRAWLAWDGRPRQGGTDAQVAKRVRSELEDHGMLVLHLSMGADGWRGFSLRSPEAPVIVANTQFTYRPRVFTYLHELAHLSADTQRMCPVRSGGGLERWCDQVAGAILMPAGEITRFVGGELRVREVADVEQVRRVANAFTVSLRAAAVRLEHLQLGRAGLYDTVDAVAKVREATRSGGGGGRPRLVIRLQTLGRGYVVPILDAEASRLLSRSDTIELLDITVNELDELRSLTASDALAEE